MLAHNQRLHSDMRIFFSIAAVLIATGFIFIYSAGSVYAFEKFGFGLYFVKKQIAGLLLGMIGFIFLRLIPLRLIKKMSLCFFVASLLLTCLTLIPTFSARIHGARRWLSLPGISFQPSELLKLGLLLYIARFLSTKSRKLDSFISGYFPFSCMVLVPCVVLLKQPDFGTAVTLACSSFTLFFVMQCAFIQFAVTLCCLVPVILTLILKYPYRLKRVMTFLDPWADPQGAGFQIIQSLIAIGSGSMWGVGISHSKQKFFYLPMQHTDFIFSIIAEEIGFAGAIFLIALYVALTYFGLRIAWQLTDKFSMLFVVGFVVLINLQTIINLAVATGLAPTKGIGLPFVSYGNTALVTNLCMLGIVSNCVAENRL